MGLPTFYYYPNGAGLKRVTVGAGTGGYPDAADEDADPVGGWSQAGSGRIHTVIRARPQNVYISLPLLTRDSSTAQEVNNLRDYAQRGGSFGFCLDADKAVFAYGLAPWIVSQTSLPSSGNAWYEPGATLAANDAVRIETAEPYRIAEQNKIPIGGYSGAGAINVANGITFTQPVIGWHRYADYWPYLRLMGPDGWEVSHEENGLFQRHEIRARVDFYALSQGQSWARAITTSTTPKKSPDDFMRSPLPLFEPSRANTGS